ncbi:MAG: Arginyl-tRNA--protein transferase 1 [Candelina submexicana]|nr:MAG: Arginyl-tRNA--protein transferase 1 [Candelina submexicana]
MHKFEVALENDTFTEEKFALFANYQRLVHHEPPSKVTRAGFKRFLCSSPIDKGRSEGTRGEKLGSFHQCYRLDGRLIAMAVLDLLPQCVSGVYFIYHDDFKEWNFGKISALREAGLAIEGGYKYYYMGYYIHSCAKMRYKGDYGPQYVLDPETYQWDLLDTDLRRRLDARRYVSLSRERRLGISATSASASTEEQSPFDDDQDFQPLSLENASLFSMNMPGVMTAEQVQSQIELGKMRMILGSDIVHLEDLVGWDAADILDPKSIKCLFGGFAATMGLKATRHVVIEWNQ